MSWYGASFELQEPLSDHNAALFVPEEGTPRAVR
jgi:hypothetical protein